MKKKNRVKIIAIFDPNSLCRSLIGKTVKAFGKNSKGIWGTSEIERVYTISKIEVDYNIDIEDDEWDEWAYVNIYLKGYHHSKDGLIYTDTKFKANIKALLPKLKIDYSEQGMQGSDYVNMNISF